MAVIWIRSANGTPQHKIDTADPWFASLDWSNSGGRPGLRQAVQPPVAGQQVAKWLPHYIEETDAP